ncbi:MAG: GMC family oxidoreductase N-terminal domain-containing protein [Microthrixaceae bacterium]
MNGGPHQPATPQPTTPDEHGTCHLERRYDVVVVGSGPAGSVVACRLAQSGRRVAVLERGGVHQPGSFPECPADLLKGTQLWRNGRRIGRADALFDLRVFDDVMVLTGCGVGGTSLINAGVSVLPTPEVLADRRWPAELRNDPEWPQDVERVGDTVGTATLPDGRTPNKLTALESMGPTPGIDGQVSRAPLNVAFCDGPNAANEPMVACNGCGNCMTGCNVGAKETYDRNYLSLARTNGAHVFSSCSVKRVEATAHGWALVVCDTRRPGSCRRVEADRVVLAAGALGSTEILLRSRAEGLDLSDMVGHRFSGNGDLIAWGFDTDADADGVGLDSSGSGWLGVGPTITGVLSPTPAGDSPDVAGASSADDRGSNEGGGDPATDAWLMEDGTVPRAFAALTPVLLALSALLDRLPVGAGLEGALGWMRSIFDGPYRGRYGEPRRRSTCPPTTARVRCGSRAKGWRCGGPGQATNEASPRVPRGWPTLPESWVGCRSAILGTAATWATARCRSTRSAAPSWEATRPTAS